MNVDGKAMVKVFRFDPAVDRDPRYETYEVPAEVWQNRKVMDVLKYIYQNHAPGLAFREACYQGLCGCCTLKVNGRPVLACETFAEQEMVIDPLNKDKIIKDLISGKQKG
jgi:succinate dehydrogenase/fumarate reductase iron-sulfur protein